MPFLKLLQQELMEQQLIIMHDSSLQEYSTFKTKKECIQFLRSTPFNKDCTELHEGIVMVMKETYELYDPHFSVRHESTPPTLDQTNYKPIQIKASKEREWA